MLHRIQKLYETEVDLRLRLRASTMQWRMSGKKDFIDLRGRTLAYVSANAKKDVSVGAYSYLLNGPSLLYASCYAALTLHLYGEISHLSDAERQQWISFLQSHQCDDGMFRDPLIRSEEAETMDWWGTRHLTLHVLMALTALGGRATKPIRLIDQFRIQGEIVTWLEGRVWKTDPASVSNEVQNYGTFLQYARDFQGQSWCQGALDEMYTWLDRQQDPKTGLWGDRFNTSRHLSEGVQTGYHLWMLYFYDNRPLQYLDRIIDSCLKTQNRYGGFGVALNSSACEDIDTIDPLVRLYFMTDYRRDEIRFALERAYYWVLTNANPEGGWVFQRNAQFRYGHDLMTAERQQSSMFPTWFRTLSLAYLAKVLQNTPIAEYDWQFINSPGHQFWHEFSEGKKL